MSKSIYKSELLKPKAIPVMIEASKEFREKTERYENLNNKTHISKSEKREKVILKDYITLQIKSYKTNSSNWVLTNGPTGAGKKELTAEENQMEEVA